MNALKPLNEMTPEEIKAAVNAKYSQVAATPGADFNFPVGREFAESVGYPKELLDQLPASMWESFTGAGNPQPSVDAKPGGRTIFSEVVLKSALPEDVRKSVKDWFRCIGGSLPKPDFVTLMAKTGFERIEVLSEGRNARTGHELALCANIRALKPT